MIAGHFEGSLTKDQAHHGIGKGLGDRYQVTIDVLPDVALLTIFDFYMDKKEIQAWHTLVHVCQKWRFIIFGSPRRLNLRIHWKPSCRRPMKEMLEVWPPFRLVVSSFGYDRCGKSSTPLAAILEHNDRICELDFRNLERSELKTILPEMQLPFPALTRLRLELIDDSAPVFPASFLGGSAPQLRSLTLRFIPFPGLPNLLLSATHLVDLEIRQIPRSGSISPDAMVTCLSELTRLEKLSIGFGFPETLPGWKSQRSRPPTRPSLPVLTYLRFLGRSEYLEELVARFDVPLLDRLSIIFYHQQLFETPQLSHFITRTPKFKTHDEALVILYDTMVSLTLPQAFGEPIDLKIFCSVPNLQLSSLAQVCSSFLPRDFNRAVEHLYIIEDLTTKTRRQDNVESSRWLELFHTFTAMKGLYISRELAPCILLALREYAGASVPEALPAIQASFLEKTVPSRSIPETIGRFIIGHRRAEQLVAVSLQEGKRFE